MAWNANVLIGSVLFVLCLVRPLLVLSQADSIDPGTDGPVGGPEMMQQGGPQMQSDPDGKSGKLSFKPPNLSDEESHSPFMPDNLRCDGCRAVTFQLFSALRKAYVQNSKLKGNLPESIIMDAFDSVCHGKGVFETYGIRLINNVKRLIGPGLPEADEPGIMQGGGKWPSRLHDMCDQFAGDLEEENIYAVFKKRPEDLKNFENYLCRGPETGLRGACSKLEGKRAKVEL